MQPKPFSCLLMIATMAIINNSLLAQCELPKPPGSHNLCNPSFQTILSSTSNSIMITNPGTFPPGGSCDVTISYYDENISACAPVMNCQGTIDVSGQTITLTLNNCSGLPDFSAVAILYINIQTSAGVYYIHVRNFSCDFVLPITLRNFRGQPDVSNNGKKIMNLTWETVSEQNSLRFDVLRSNDGINFYKIGQVPAAGNSNAILYYAFTDQTFVTGNNFYKLRMVDEDGTCEHSTIVTAKCVSTSTAACAPSIPGPVNCSNYIIGPSYVCTSDPVYYSVSLLPAYSSVTWSIDANANYANMQVDPCEPNRVRLTKFADVPIRLTANVNRCNSPVIKQIYNSQYPSGTYTYDGVQYDLNYDNGQGSGYYEIHMDCPECTNLQWERVEGTVPYNVISGTRVGFWLNQGDYVAFQFSGSNPCTSFGGSANYYYFAPGWFYSVSPNPATSTVTIKQVSSGASKKTTDRRIRQIQLLDAFGVLQKAIPGKYSEQMQINVSDLKPGYYLLKIFYGNKIQTKKIRVK